MLAIIGNSPRLVAIGHDQELVSSLRQAFHAQDLDWRSWRRFLYRMAAIVEHGANFAIDIADNEIVTVAQGPVLHQHGRHRPASAVEFGFEHNAGCRALRIRFQFLQIRNQANHFEQKVEVSFLFRRNIDENRLAAPIFRHESAVGELLLDPFWQRAGLIDFIHRNDDRHFCGMGVVDSFDRLRHHSIISSDD